ncbi:hypothetical protein Ami103574_11635 [Aminipila butyrica]|uniref:Uncharacterized protein n=1 Tax=Aminipila butyrica TaxID=433296 RepID=A0A858BWZ7_9FIRM|nr:hypothetical protein [Aminipila butyrica]QIB69932.1 hypothetical protein Ami103574_11635 [Aminipila butyrica]
MKQFIVMMGVLPILLLFMMQMGLDQKNSQVTSIIQASVYAAKEEAKQQGCFTEAIKDKLKEDIIRLTGIPEEHIDIEAEEKVKYRYASGENRLIHYKVTVQIQELMAAHQIYGISEEDNSYDYIIESYTASEKV